MGAVDNIDARLNLTAVVSPATVGCTQCIGCPQNLNGDREMVFETKEEVLEKILGMQKPICPHCDKEMSIWEVPPINFSDGLGTVDNQKSKQ